MSGTGKLNRCSKQNIDQALKPSHRESSEAGYDGTCCNTSPPDEKTGASEVKSQTNLFYVLTCFKYIYNRFLVVLVLYSPNWPISGFFFLLIFRSKQLLLKLFKLKFNFPTTLIPAREIFGHQQQSLKWFVFLSRTKATDAISTAAHSFQVLLYILCLLRARTPEQEWVTLPNTCKWQGPPKSNPTSEILSHIRFCTSNDPTLKTEWAVIRKTHYFTEKGTKERLSCFTRQNSNF